MADVSPKYIYGDWEGGYDSSHGRRIYAKATWGTIPLGATSISVTIEYYIQSTGDYALSDSVNDFTTTFDGSTYTTSDIPVSLDGVGGDLQLIYTKVKTVTISQTVTKAFTVTARFWNLGSGGAVDLSIDSDDSYTVTLPASGIPYAHPTITANAFNFGSATQSLSFLVSGGTNYSILNVVVHIYTTRTGTTDAVVTNFPLTVAGASITASGTTRYVPISSANLLNILNYWATLKEITRIGLTVTTHSGTLADQVVTVYFTPLSMAAAFSITSLTVTRGANNGTNTTAEAVVAIAKMSTAIPFYQYGSWPSNITVTVRRTNSSGTTITTTGVLSGDKKTWSGADTWAIPLSSGTYVYWMGLYNGTTLLSSTTFTVAVADVRISIIPGGSVDALLMGLGTGSPTKMLDVNGEARVRDVLTADGLIYSQTKQVLVADPAYNPAITWTAITLTDNGGFTAVAGVVPSVALLPTGVCICRGRWAGKTGLTSNILGTLPAACHPAIQLNFVLWGYTGSTFAPVFGYISTAGVINIQSPGYATWASTAANITADCIPTYAI